MIICALSSNCLLTAGFGSETGLWFMNLMKSERPDWLILLIFLLFFAYLVFRRYLSHRERQEKQKTKRFSTAMENLVKIKESEEQTKKIRVMGSIVRNDKGNVVGNTDFKINKWQDELNEMATAYFIDDFK